MADFTMNKISTKPGELFRAMLDDDLIVLPWSESRFLPGIPVGGGHMRLTTTMLRDYSEYQGLEVPPEDRAKWNDYVSTQQKRDADPIKIVDLTAEERSVIDQMKVPGRKNVRCFAVSSKKGLSGAASFFAPGAEQKVSRKASGDGDYYMIPESDKRFLIMPKAFFPSKLMAEVVIEDAFSYHAFPKALAPGGYLYDAKKQKLIPLFGKIQERAERERIQETPGKAEKQKIEEEEMFRRQNPMAPIPPRELTYEDEEMER